jgi:hypothetical protein
MQLFVGRRSVAGDLIQSRGHAWLVDSAFRAGASVVVGERRQRRSGTGPLAHSRLLAHSAAQGSIFLKRTLYHAFSAMRFFSAADVLPLGLLPLYTLKRDLGELQAGHRKLPGAFLKSPLS